jgi:chemotaxis protein methyltransferase CheR
MTPVMEQTTFDRLREIVYETSGISLSERKEALVSARVGKRMRTLGIRDYEHYLHYL